MKGFSEFQMGFNPSVVALLCFVQDVEKKITCCVQHQRGAGDLTECKRRPREVSGASKGVLEHFKRVCMHVPNSFEACCVCLSVL